MTTTADTRRSDNPTIVSDPATSPAWWFLGTLAVLRNPPGAPRTPAVVELTVPPGGSPPLHVHESLDDSFMLLEGELVVRCGKDTVVAKAGSYVVMPHGVEHTFRVTSPVPARMLLVHADDSFLSFIEELGTPTTEHRLPPPGEFDLDFATLAERSAAHGAPMIGPSLDEDEARSFAQQSAGEPKLDTINHVALNVTDLPRSERWYTEALGLVRVDGQIAPDGTGHIALLSPTGGWIVALASAASPAVEHVAFTCATRDDLLRRRQLLADQGIQVGTVTDAPYGSGFVVRDPDGIDVELFAPASHPA
jgi:catechol 2,3-dioxygenase-like lactoylglutathione lyase family enzyme/mannose-6-phosphate isomerase-like protein (cupin superfamily)